MRVIVAYESLISRSMQCERVVEAVWFALGSFDLTNLEFHPVQAILGDDKHLAGELQKLIERVVFQRWQQR